MHVPLPTDTHARLKAQSKRSGQPTTVLVREAIEAWLAEREKEALHDAISDYARMAAGTPDDLDSDLESAAVEQLLHGDET
ncbi:MAG: hypothetical protein OXF11_20060 [Deltaproteobacteria bacterium]|nr:hypothetical protein [Deltaproteobacteria bacterium]